MANDFTGRIWRITTTGTTPFGTVNFKIKGGSWTGGVAGNTFTITDEAGRTYTWTFPTTAEQVTFQELGWLSGPVTFGGTFVGEIDLYLGTK
jgi:hypothetical protein